MAVAASLLNTIGRGKALLLSGDISTACISEKDKSTAPIFSDAGSATALQRKEGAPAMYFNLQGDGKGLKRLSFLTEDTEIPLPKNHWNITKKEKA